jgi:hypothetical protein
VKFVVPAAYCEATELCDLARACEEAGFEAIGVPIDAVHDLTRTFGLGRLVADHRERLLVLGAKHDQIVTPDNIRGALAQTSGAQTMWLDGGHFTSLFSPLLRALPQIRCWADAVPPSDAATGGG